MTDTSAAISRAAEAPPAPRKGFWHWPRRHALFALPAIILIVALFAFPLILNTVLSFTNWTSYSPRITFAGIANFKFLWQQGYLQKGTTVTLIYAVIAMAGQNLVAIILALALRDTNRLNGFFRALFFLPVLISPVAGGYIWRALLAPQGPINGFIGLFLNGFDYNGSATGGLPCRSSRLSTPGNGAALPPWSISPG